MRLTLGTFLIAYSAKTIMSSEEAGEGLGIQPYLDTDEEAPSKQESDDLIREALKDYYLYPDEDGVLGEGAFGKVLKAQRRESEQQEDVAVKQIPIQAFKSEEIELVRRLKNPFIIHYFDVILHADSAFIIMELCDCDLGRFLADFGKCTEENVETLARNVAQGYLALHENFIVHRDMKANNLLLLLRDELSFPPELRKGSLANITRKISQSLAHTGQDGVVMRPQPKILKVKISDFGSSREHRPAGADEEEMMQVAGTFSYMAPEIGANILEPSDYCGAVDMWSIGVVLFECATGHVAFDEAALCKLFLRATNEDFEGYKPPLPKETSRRYQRLIVRLLEINPHFRLKPRPFHDFLIYDHPLPALTNRASYVSSVRASVRRRSLRSAKTLQMANQEVEEEPPDGPLRNCLCCCCDCMHFCCSLFKTK